VSRVGGARPAVLWLALFCIIAPGTVAAQAPPSPFRADLGLRPGYHAAWRTDRDGQSSHTDDFRLRAQLGGWWTPSAVWSVRARLAGRLATDQEHVRFFIRDHVPATDGLLKGDFTVDEAFVRWRPDSRVELRAGRMQTTFELAGVPRKSLDRNDSPNTDVTWTDGVHAAVRLRDGWRQHLILQHNSTSGPTSVVRAPLDVTGSGSRVTAFTLAQLEGRWGPFVQRELGVTYMPAVVPASDPGAPRDHYTTIVARLAVEPGVTVAGGRAVLGTEVGVAPVTPPRHVLRTGTADESGDGLAIQLSANLMDMGGRHSFGVVASRAGDGWLISSDIRDNNREIEARYYLRYASWGRLDLRVRHREDLYLRTGAQQKRQDRDIYIRTTLRF
jgi:hypothetical protein